MEWGVVVLRWRVCGSERRDKGRAHVREWVCPRGAERICVQGACPWAWLPRGMGAELPAEEPRSAAWVCPLRDDTGDAGLPRLLFPRARPHRHGRNRFTSCRAAGRHSHSVLSPVQSQPLTHVMPQRHPRPKGADKCREGGVYIKFAVAKLGEKTSAALNNPAKAISCYPSLEGAGGNEEACEFCMWEPLDLPSQAPVLRYLGMDSKRMDQCFS